MLLRRATKSDAAAVAYVYLSSRKEFLPYAPLAHTDEEVRAWIEQSLVPAGRVTVAEMASEIIGFVTTTDADGCLWIDQLYVRPASTGRGIGSALLRHAMTGASQPVRLYTFQANNGARRFYERFGFAPMAFTDGRTNEEQCPDVLYELPIGTTPRNPAAERALDSMWAVDVERRIDEIESGQMPIAPVEQAIARAKRGLR